MKKFGKTIKLFLIDGEPNGRMTCELSNWTGKAYKIPRIMIKNSYSREELKNPGVYLLLGENETGKNQIYIGEAETIIDRLKHHVAYKEFWTEAIVFISKDENLNKAHIKFLESRLVETATEVNRYEIKNEQNPTKSSISESETAEMEEFLENIKLLTNSLGHRVFEETIDKESISIDQSNTFTIISSKGTNSKGIPSPKGFIVLEGSEITTQVVKSFQPSLVKMRHRLIEEGILDNSNNKLVFNKDYEFSSPSTAASIVLGRSSNGLIEWKLKEGKTLKDVETS